MWVADLSSSVGQALRESMEVDAKLLRAREAARVGILGQRPRGVSLSD
jgi:hypothetical protein